MSKAFVINGMGHCGTRTVHSFSCATHARLPNVSFLENMSDLEKYDISRNCTFKTHSPFPFDNTKPLKVLYMFGDIFNSIVSFDDIETPHSGESGKLAEFAGRFLHADQSENFWEVDTFQYKRHFDNWNVKHNYPVLMIRYESLWDNLPIVLDFLEIPKKKHSGFPKKVKRKTNWENESSETKEKLIRVYGKTRDYLNSQPDIIARY